MAITSYTRQSQGRFLFSRLNKDREKDEKQKNEKNDKKMKKQREKQTQKLLNTFTGTTNARNTL